MSHRAATHLRRRLSLGTALLSLLALVGIAGCGDPDPGQKAPTCEACHDVPRLVAPRSSAPLRAWAGRYGEGLVRRPVLIPSSRQAFAAPYPRRGNHAASAPGTCAACHPVSGQGVRHGVSQYPSEARRVAFAGGKDCAEACHGWLPETFSSPGFLPATGYAPVVMGTLRPGALLAASDGAHGRIFREGYTRPAGVALKLQRLKPGCAGCHNVRNERHGTVTECAECHRFDGVTGALHQTHLEAIDARRDALDPGHSHLPACRYCHGFVDEGEGGGEGDGEDLHQAACYNCHLSGHQPLDAGGQPHFWPIP